MPQLDHLALGVADLDRQRDLLTGVLGLRAHREGRQYGSDRRILLLSDPASGLLLELIEDGGAVEHGGTDVLRHVAWRVDDVGAAGAPLERAGARIVRPAHRLEAARATSGLYALPSGLAVQLIAYEPDSPDLRR